ncbi:MAG: signal peptidase I [Candidatus Liptonbacteria bacterium]|nr:signal peptidase I [Candidatus Liptonbacteria bacterium]
MDLLKKYLPVLIAALLGGIIGALIMRGGGTVPSTGSGPSAGFSFKGGPSAGSGQTDCKTTEEKMTIAGDSLAGIVQSGAQVKVVKSYYACKDANRGDIVVYGYAGGTQPLAKIVKAIPGDKFELKKSGNGWNILVNGAPAKNSKGTAYLLGEQQYRLLSLYVKDYGGVIPGNAYLIMGDDPAGSLDSSRFGLVDKSDFLGKVGK